MTARGPGRRGHQGTFFANSMPAPKAVGTLGWRAPDVGQQGLVAPAGIRCAARAICSYGHDVAARLFGGRDMHAGRMQLVFIVIRCGAGQRPYTATYRAPRWCSDVFVTLLEWTLFLVPAPTSTNATGPVVAAGWMFANVTLPTADGRSAYVESANYSRPRTT